MTGDVRRSIILGEGRGGEGTRGEGTVDVCEE